MEANKHECPVCLYKTLSEINAFEVCPVCFWEDDPVARDNERSGANEWLTLAEAQENYGLFGAFLRKFKPYVRKPLDNE